MPRPNTQTRTTQPAASTPRRAVSDSDDAPSDDSETERRSKPRASGVGGIKKEMMESAQRKPRPSELRAALNENVDDEEEEEEEVDEVQERYKGWTIAEYQPVPLTKDNDSLITKTLASLMAVANEISRHIAKAITVAQAFEEIQEGAPEVEQIEQGYMRCLEQKQIIEYRHAALTAIRERLKAGDAIDDPVAQYQAACKATEDRYLAQTPRQKFQDDEDYKVFRQVIWDCHHQGQPCPSMADFLPRRPGDEENDDEEDDDVQIGVQTQNIMDPITLQPIKDAVIIPACGHHFSRATISGMLEQHKGKRKTTTGLHIKCPRSDCQVKFSEYEVKSDPVFQGRVDAQLARETQRQNRVEESDDDLMDVNEDDFDEDE